MQETENVNLRNEQLSLLVGTMIGQISELLNSIKRSPMTNEMIYTGLLDINKAASLQVHELFYKSNKP